MAFDRNKLSVMAVTGVQDENGDPKGVGFYFYHANGDNALAADYFADALKIGMKENDLVYILDDDAGSPVIGYVNADGTVKNVDVTPET